MSGRYTTSAAKMLFFRATDIRGCVRRALVDMLGADADRVAAWDRLATGGS